MRTCRQLLVSTLVLATLGLGCAGAQHLDVRPEKLYEHWPGDGVSYRKVGELDITMGSFTLLGYPFAIPNLTASIESEVQAANADAVTDLQVRSKMRVVGFVLGLTQYTATGDLIVYE